MENPDNKFSEEELDRILRDKWTGPVRAGYVTIKGCTLPEAYQKYQKEIDDFEVYDSDTWICSFPRTGTTWTSEMVWMIANNFNKEKAKALLNARVPFLDSCFLLDGRDTSGLPKDLSDAINYTRNQAHPRFIKTHLPFQLLPKQIQNGEKKPKIVYVCRNPLDVCISYYYHSISILFSGTLEEFCKLFLSNKTIYGNFWDHVLPFWRIRNEPAVLFLKYEDIKNDLAKTIRETADFLGKSVSEEMMDNLQTHLSIEAMKNNPSVNRGRSVDFVKLPGATDTPFIRSGIVGGYKKEMPPQFIDLFEKWTENKFSGTDLRF